MAFTAYRTGWMESNVLIAVLDDNPAGARAIVAEMTPGERRRMSEALGELDELLTEFRDR